MLLSSLSLIQTLGGSKARYLKVVRGWAREARLGVSPTWFGVAPQAPLVVEMTTL